MANRVEVDLQLMASKDLDRLEGILNKFMGGLGAATGGGVGGGSMGNHAAATTAEQEAYYKEMRDERTKQRDDQRLLDAYNNRGGIGRSLLNMALVRSPASVQDGRIVAGRINPLGTVEHVGAALAFGPQAISNVANIGGLATGFSNMMYGAGFTAGGVQAGYSAQGGVFSPAFRYGIGNTYQGIQDWARGLLTGGTTNFGDVRGFQQAMQEFGWNTNQASYQQMRSANARNNGVWQGIPMQVRSELFDTTRFGGSSIDQVTQALNDMQSASIGAGLGLSQVAESLNALATQMSQQYGISAPRATLAGQALITGTGLRPDVAASSMSPTMMRIQLAQNIANGVRNPYLTTYGTARGMVSGAVTSYDMLMRYSQLGNNLDDARRVLHSQGRNYVLNLLFKSYSMRDVDPALSAAWGNMNPYQVLQLIERGDTGVRAGSQFGLDVDQAHHFLATHPHGSISDSRFHDLTQEAVTALGGGARAQAAVDRAIAAGGSRETILQRIRNRLNKVNAAQRNANSLGHVSISLAGEASRVFKFSTPNDSSDGNKATVSHAGTAVQVNVPDASGSAGRVGMANFAEGG